MTEQEDAVPTMVPMTPPKPKRGAPKGPRQTTRRKVAKIVESLKSSPGKDFLIDASPQTVSTWRKIEPEYSQIKMTTRMHPTQPRRRQVFIRWEDSSD